MENHDLVCMEVWGGNSARRTAISTPGLDAWVRSEPYQQARAGGDVYYASMCGAGAIARYSLADVSGHGESIAGFATSLRHMMRKHINQLDQSRFARSLNEELTALSTEGRFATALLTTYFAPTDHLVVVNAGHPRPLWRRRSQAKWQLLTPESVGADALPDHLPPGNLPLGIIEPTSYEQFAAPLDVGDLILIYSDALTEARSPGGKMLGEQGLLDLMETLDIADPATLADRLVDAIHAYRGGAASDDPLTVMVLHHNAGNPPPQSLLEKMTVVAKMLGLVKT